MINQRYFRVVDAKQWNDLVGAVYGKPYDIVQQPYVLHDGTTFVSVSETPNDDRYLPDDFINEEHEGTAWWGVKLDAWLAKQPSDELSRVEEEYWHQRFYPRLQSLANDLAIKGFISPDGYIFRENKYSRYGTEKLQIRPQSSGQPTLPYHFIYEVYESQWIELTKEVYGKPCVLSRKDMPGRSSCSFVVAENPEPPDPDAFQSRYIVSLEQWLEQDESLARDREVRLESMGQDLLERGAIKPGEYVIVLERSVLETYPR